MIPTDAPVRRFRGVDASPVRVAPKGESPSNAHTPTLDRLPGEARSVTVPAVLTFALVALSAVLVVVATTLVALAVSRSAALEDLDNLERDLSPSQIQACEQRQGELDTARRSHVARTGDAPDDIDQLDPGAQDFVLDRSGHPVPAPGSLCEGVADGARTTDQAVADRADAAGAAIAASVGVGLLGVALLALLGAPVMLSYWLATAFRCMPQTARHDKPRRAYGIVSTYAVLVPLQIAAFALIGTYVGPEEPFTAGVLWVLVSVLGTGLLVRAILRVVSMIGDVTFEFCHRHYGTSRAMELSLLAWLLMPLLAGSMLILAVNSGSAWGATVLVYGALAVFAIGMAAPFVFTVCLVVAVWLATAGIERTLKDAAQELATAEAYERMYPPSERPLGV